MYDARKISQAKKNAAWQKNSFVIGGMSGSMAVMVVAGEAGSSNESTKLRTKRVEILSQA